MTTATHSTDTPAKKLYARPMTEKRREQNRRSQKIYREKLKKKLEELEEQLQEKTQPRPKQSSSPLEATVGEIVEHKITSPVSSTSSKSKINTIDLNAAFAAAGDLALPTDTTLPTFQLGIRDRSRQTNSPSIAPSSADIITPDDAAIPKLLAVDVYAPSDPGSLDMRMSWPIPAQTYLETYTPPTAKQRRIPRNTTFAPARITSSLSWSPYSRNPSENTTPTGIPSPYLNHLRLLGESAFRATLAIATSLGITRSAYVNDHPSPFSPTYDQIPWYNYKAIPKDLRPTREQITLIHPSYLDCIVFPKFRSNAIVLASRGELDHCSLFLDLMHDGLVCWGNENASQSSSRDMRDGVAWSKRSWEARPWFLKKWGWLLSIDPHVPGIGLARGPGIVTDEDEDDTDEMFESSRWWRAMRGEDMQDQDDEGEVFEEHGEMLSRTRTCNIGLRDHNEFAANGTLWPTQFADPMAKKLNSLGMSASYAMLLGEE